MRVRSIVLIAMLAMARKFIILGLKKAASAKPNFPHELMTSKIEKYRRQ